MINYYNVHGLVRIKVENKSEIIQHEIKVHLREFITSEIPDEEIDIIINDYEKKVIIKDPVIISDYYYYNDNWLDIPTQNLCFNFEEPIIKVFCNRMFIPTNLLVELVLLKKDYTMIHSAGFEYNGKNYLIPTYGGVGKTTTLAKLMEKDAKIYGDDIIIIKGKEVLSYPIDFSVYPYHYDILKINNKTIEKKFKKTRKYNRLIKNLSKYDNKLFFKVLKMGLKYFNKEYFPIPPRDIFGNEFLANKGEISGIYYLIKQDNNCDKITIEDIDHSVLADIATDILLSEWAVSLQLLLIYSGLSTFSFKNFLQKINIIYLQAFEKSVCRKIILPAKLDFNTYIDQFISDLD